MKALLIALSCFALAALSLPADEARPAPAASHVTNVSPDEAEKLLKENPKTLVLDVRTSDEFAKSHIPGAKNVDIFDDNFAKKVGELDPKTPIIVHCAAGGRSKQALEFLKDKMVVYHLNDGFTAWEKAGKPVEGAAKK
jgi:rhodanese-related sulfurtransferase